VAFALFEPLDGGALHLEEIDVHPDHAGQRLGARLLDAAAAWARELGHTEITLTTFRHVPWNAPYYERIGFRVVERERWSEGVAERVAREARNGLDPERRVVMRRPIGARDEDGEACA
jgi:predicted N-acetyltransferase YhbS